MAKKSCIVPVRLEEYYDRQIKKYADKFGITKTAMARLCIEKSIDRNNGMTLEIPLEDETHQLLSAKCQKRGISESELVGEILTQVLPLL